MANDKDWNGDVDLPTFGHTIERDNCTVRLQLGLMWYGDGDFVELPDLPDWVN